MPPTPTQQPAVMDATDGPLTSRNQFYEAAMRLRQLCVRKRDSLIAALKITKAQYFADPGQYLVRLQCHLWAWDMSWEEWYAGLALIAEVNMLGHPEELDLADTIRADVVCVAAHSANFLGGVPDRWAQLEKPALSRVV